MEEGFLDPSPSAETREFLSKPTACREKSPSDSSCPNLLFGTSFNAREGHTT
uniref:Uncharacterized protein n=1 Tax=Rhizophora mucronata TaxID=61149 RepID=A0A2P2MME1_RHIMU